MIEYINFRLSGDQSNGIKPVQLATAKNIQSCLNVLVNANRDADDKRQLSSKDTGLPTRSRLGKKRAITDEEFSEVICRAQMLGDAGFVLVLKLERLIGLRCQEALMINDGLQRFMQMRFVAKEEPQFFEVLQGAKGGRYRAAEFIKSRQAQTLNCLEEAARHLKQNNGYLLRGKSSGLKSALLRYHNLCRKLGLVGEIAPHSFRYAYAQEKIRELQASGRTAKEASRWAALFLGHGVSRDRFIRMVYGQGSKAEPDPLPLL
jgi:hypothetical protein